MTTFERRQRILALLREKPGLRVVELAALLDVSEGTIRNDLTALEEAGHLTRVRGGAALTDERQSHSAAFAARARANEASKQQIARWAAELVDDGDSILLDASTTVYAMARYLQDRRSLRVVTNGVEVGLRLAQNPSNSVILLGGNLHADSGSVTGPLSEAVLKDLHIKTAFVSCSGLTLERGLTEEDLSEAQLKSRMVACSDAAVALVDASKFGQEDLTSFARVEQIARIYTDSSLDLAWIEHLQRTGTILTVCDQDTVSSYSARAGGHYRIGFANLSEQVGFSVDVRRGVERAAQGAGNIDLILGDNQLDGRVALQVADRLIASGIDLAIEYQLDHKAGDVVMAKFREAGIPVIAVDIPMVGATFFGVDNYRAGQMAGQALGGWIQAHWGGWVDRLIVLEEPRAGPLPAARIRGQIDGLESVIGRIPPDRVLALDSGNRVEVSEEHMALALADLPGEHRLAVVCFNDEAALGAIGAARKLGREADLAVVGQGADRRARAEMALPSSPLVGSTAYEPERYGTRLIALSLRILRGEPVPPAVYVDHVFVARPDWALPGR